MYSLVSNQLIKCLRCLLSVRWVPREPGALPQGLSARGGEVPGAHLRSRQRPRRRRHHLPGRAVQTEQQAAEEVRTIEQYN